jgi:hypothetical protein
MEFASYFRKSIFVDVVNELLQTMKKSQSNTNTKNRIRGTAFLEDSDVVYLAQYYKVHILVFEGEKSSKEGEIHTGRMSKCILMHTFGKDDKVYMIYNHGNLHFEPVQEGTNDYTISMSVAKDLQEKFMCEQHGKQNVHCKYTIGDRVSFKHAEPPGAFFVIHRTIDPTNDFQCSEYVLANEENWKRFQTLSDTEKDEPETVKKLQSAVGTEETIESMPETTEDPKPNNTRKNNIQKSRKTRRKMRRKGRF